MLGRVLRGRGHRRRRPAPAPPPVEEDRTSGEDARESHEVYVEAAAAPGVPRLKAKNL